MELGWLVSYGELKGKITMADRKMRYGIEVEFEPDKDNKKHIAYFDFGGNPGFKNPEFEGKLIKCK